MSYDVDIVVDHGDGYKTTVFSENITYNIRRMLEEAGLEDSLYTLQNRTCAEVQDLLYGVWRELRTRPEHYRQFEPSNGWGTHEHLLPWIRKLYWASRQHPRGVIRIW